MPEQQGRLATRASTGRVTTGVRAPGALPSPFPARPGAGRGRASPPTTPRHAQSAARLPHYSQSAAPLAAPARQSRPPGTFLLTAPARRARLPPELQTLLTVLEEATPTTVRQLTLLPSCPFVAFRTSCRTSIRHFTTPPSSFYRRCRRCRRRDPFFIPHQHSHQFN